MCVGGGLEKDDKREKERSRYGKRRKDIHLKEKRGRKTERGREGGEEGEVMKRTSR